MVISGWEMYLITRMDAICGMALAVLLLAGAASAILFAMTAISFHEYSHYIDKGDSYEEEREREKRSYDYIKRLFKISGIVTIAAAILLTFIPTTKDIALIYVVPAVTKNEQVQKLPDNLMKFLNAKMEKWTEEATGKKPEEQKK
jgi:hypothetical protein